MLQNQGGFAEAMAAWETTPKAPNKGLPVDLSCLAEVAERFRGLVGAWLALLSVLKN